MLSKKSSQQKAYWALAWVSFAWGTTWIASKLCVEHTPPFQVIGLRQFIGGILFVAYFIYKKHPLPKKEEWKPILILTVLNFLTSNGFVIWGVKYISSGLAAIIGAIFPLWIVIFSWFRNHRIPPLAIAGIVVGFGGICTIFYDHLNEFLNSGFRFGITISLIASVTWALAAFYTQRTKYSFNAYYSLGIQMILSGSVFLVAAYATGDTQPLLQIPAVTWWSLSYLIIIGSLFTFVAYVYTLHHLPASFVSLYAYINPIVAFILGVLILHEKISPHIVIGGIITLLGVFTVNSALRGKG
jgi:drug/metabolite transporter (DMT)-like permease